MATRRGQAWDLFKVFLPVIVIHVVAFGVYLTFVAPQHLQMGSTVFGVGLAVTAYVLGVKHAFDADHIAAIDNTTRKLVDMKKPAAGVGTSPWATPRWSSSWPGCSPSGCPGRWG